MMPRYWIYSLASFFLAGCGGGSGGGSSLAPPLPPPPPVSASFQDVTANNLPTASLNGRCMDADHGDVDADGDLDIALAQEFGTNIVLLNDGSGVFTLAIGAVGGGSGDNEDVRLRDMNADSTLDMLTVHEDDAVHALLFNDGSGVFTDMSSLIPVSSVANATEIIDLNNDTMPDILLGNAGENIVLIQQGSGSFTDDTMNRPIGSGTTQDLLVVNIDGDADQDLFVANETANRLFVNDGNGFFVDESSVRLPGIPRETREVDTADIDNDGDLDIVVANVSFNFNSSNQNQLLVNNGSGVFADATATNLANVDNAGNSFTIKFVDIDTDGDPDILSPTNNLNQGGNISVWINDGTGVYSDATQTSFSSPPSGSLFDVEVFDVNADGMNDIYFCHRTGTDQLYIRM